MQQPLTEDEFKRNLLKILSIIAMDSIQNTVNELMQIHCDKENKTIKSRDESYKYLEDIINKY